MDKHLAKPLTTSLLFFFLLLTLPLSAAEQVAHGLADLRGWNLSERAVLDGDWEFYWNQLKGPRDFPAQAPDYARVGRPWESHFGKRMPIYGQATYRLKVLLPPAAVKLPLRLRTQLVASRFKCYANGTLMGQNGLRLDPAHDADSSVATFVPFVSARPELELVCQVRNHELLRSGLSRHIEIAPAEAMKAQNLRYNTIFTLIEGLLSFACLYHLILFWQRRRDKLPLWFGLICAATLIYYDTMLPHNLERLLGEMPFDWALKLARASVYLVMTLLTCYLRELLPLDVPRSYVRGCGGLCLVAALGVLVVPPGFLPAYGLLYLLWGVVLVNESFLLFTLARAWWLKRPDIGLFVFSSGFYALTSIHDVLEDARVIVSMPFLSALGLTVFCVSQSVFIARRFNRAFEQAETLSDALRHINQNLEAIVGERTQELAAKNQQLQELSYFKHSLTQMIIHDLKNPLGAILGFTQSRRVPAERAFRIIHRSGFRMLNLIQNLLDIQRIEETQLQLQPETLKLQQIVGAACDQLLFLSEQGPRLQNLIDEDLRVEADRQVLERVLLNLIGNAFKYTPPTGLISLAASLEDATVWIHVTDTGRGIPAEELPHVFDKFRGAGRSEVQASSGLGLTFCKLAIDAHGGQIRIESECGRGTLVSFSLTGSRVVHRLDGDRALELSNAAREQLAPVLTALAALDIYEISEIHRVLRPFAAQALSPELMSWLGQLNALIDAFDDAGYQHFLATSGPAEGVK